MRLSVASLLWIAAGLILLAACGSPGGGLTSVPPTALPATPRPTNTPRVLPSPGPTHTPSQPLPTSTAVPPTPTPTPAGLQLAYIHQGDVWLVSGVEGAGIQLTQAGGITAFTWSPDGQTLAYVHQDGGGPALYIMPGDRSRPPQPLGAGDQPTWAPDGHRLAFVRAGQIYIIAADGSGERRLSQDDAWLWGNPVFTADGKSVIAGGADRNTIGASGNAEFYLYSFPIEGGPPTRLPALGKPFAGRLPGDLRLAPGGGYLAFFTSFHHNACSSPGDYYVLASDGGGAHSVLPQKLVAQTQPANDISILGLGFAWAPTGDRLALGAQVYDCSRFFSGGGGPILGPAAIYMVDVQGQLLAELAKPGSEVDWSPDGTRLAYVARADPLQPEGPIFTLAPDGSDERAIAPGQKPAWRP